MEHPRLFFVMSAHSYYTKFPTALYIIYPESDIMFNGYYDRDDEWTHSLHSVSELETFVKRGLAIELEWP